MAKKHKTQTGDRRTPVAAIETADGRRFTVAGARVEVGTDEDGKKPLLVIGNDAIVVGFKLTQKRGTR